MEWKITIWNITCLVVWVLLLTNTIQCLYLDRIWSYFQIICWITYTMNQVKTRVVTEKSLLSKLPAFVIRFMSKHIFVNGGAPIIRHMEEHLTRWQLMSKCFLLVRNCTKTTRHSNHFKFSVDQLCINIHFVSILWWYFFYKNKSDVKCRNTIGCLDQYSCTRLRLSNS